MYGVKGYSDDFKAQNNEQTDKWTDRQKIVS